jgi:hypothetical protein
LARLASGALGGGAENPAATIRRALADAGLQAADIRRAYASERAAALAAECLPAAALLHIPAACIGDAEGAAGALQAACALLDAPASLPALILTGAANGTATALILD